MISAVVLAAGMSRRMGEPKLLLKLGDKTIIEHVIQNVVQANVNEVILVLGHKGEAIKGVLSGYRLKYIYNPRYTEGQGTSVSAGVSAVNPRSKGIIFLLGDQPLITASHINQLIDKFNGSDAVIVRPTGAGNPTIFNSCLKNELLNLSGDVGGRQVVEKYKNHVLTVPIYNGHQSIDIDTQQDYLKVLHYLQVGKQDGTEG
ncbi:nucleotidyltransferase family protein [Desulfofalx alkaliphila]|uniref:nucleotidyltransferase family protein n=1 Tax=Desulfofalx alkaliphila TaxID=105483 RepID=UPI00069159CE|nr:nucleotidyltransferase family protein [Desulfofalx alkaliphila]